MYSVLYNEQFGIRPPVPATIFPETRLIKVYVDIYIFKQIGFMYNMKADSTHVAVYLHTQR